MKNQSGNPGQKVLVVDDEEDIAELIRFHLEENGYQVDTCQNGLEVLPKLEKKHSGSSHFRSYASGHRRYGSL